MSTTPGPSPEFEYTIRRLDWDSARFEADEITNLLNAYEAKGWQYVETVTPHTGGPVSVFRRRLR